jgi:DNA-binding transcriptional LysR family regulator
MRFSDLRFLSFDDLFLLSYLKEGFTVTECAGHLGLTQPAVSQRVRKLEQVFLFPLLKKQGRKSILTEEGMHLASRAKDAIALLAPLSKTADRGQTIRIGTRAEVGRSWLWPALKKLRRKRPSVDFHIGFGSGSELLAGLTNSSFDAVLTSAPVTMRDFDSLELAEEDYVFCACKKLADKIQRLEDIREQTWIEHDRSFPFLHYLNSKDRSKLKMENVWFVGSSELMLEAVLAGLGVGIVPGYLYRRHEKKLIQPLPKLRLESDSFRIIYSRAKPIAESLELLAEIMREDGLS